MRYIGLMLDDIINKTAVIDKIDKFFTDKTRSLKLVLYNKNVDDVAAAKFVKGNEKLLSSIGSQITRDFTVPVYFFIGQEQVSNYTMWYKGSIDKGLIHFEQLLSTQDERRKHVR